jgi:starch phosphorylase
VNGGLNLSQYDGWWAEAWNQDVGWAIRPGATFDELSGSNNHNQDLSDMNELFDLLENEVIPGFYDVDSDGIPRKWLKRMRASMDQLTAAYSANRMVREYVEQFYLPMADKGGKRTRETSKELLDEYNTITRHWPRLRFNSFNISEASEGQTFTVEVYLDGISEKRIAVELVAEQSEYGPRTVTDMEMKHPLIGSAHTYLYECTVPSRPQGHYTPRLRVCDDRLNLPLENPAILWLK